MRYQFSRRSLERLSTCHQDLRIIMMTAIRYSPVDFGISEGHRSTEKQLQYFNEGKSKIDGINKKGKHNYSPSLACDFYPFVNGKADWNNETLTYLAGIIHCAAEMLYETGKITHKIRWGGNWDKDGEILTDQSFQDRPHVELYKPL